MGWHEKILKKYHDYCKTRQTKEDIFNMQQREEESLKDYVERLLYNLQKTKKLGLCNETVTTFFSKGIKDEYLDVLSIIGSGDISYFLLTKICELCRKYS